MQFSTSVLYHKGIFPHDRNLLVVFKSKQEPPFYKYVFCCYNSKENVKEIQDHLIKIILEQDKEYEVVEIDENNDVESFLDKLRVEHEQK